MARPSSSFHYAQIKFANPCHERLELLIGATMSELFTRLRATCARSVALAVCLVAFLVAGSAHATNGTRAAVRLIGSSATQRATQDDRPIRVTADHAMLLTDHRQSPAADTDLRTPVSARVAPFEQARSHTASPAFLKVLGLYFVAGLMLGVLPASLPVALILSAVVVNNSAPTTGRRALALALCYVAGTAVANISLGLAAVSDQLTSGLLGHPPWPILFVAMLVAFAIRLLAADLVLLPARWQRTLASAPPQVRRAGEYLLVAGIGALSALAVGADTTTRLISDLAFRAPADCGIAVVLALLAMSVGLGLPLLAIGSGIGPLLRRTCAWKDGVKVFFAIELLATALLIVWPSLDSALRLVTGSLWLLVVISELGLFSSRGVPGTIWRKPGRGIAAAVAVWTTILLAGPVTSPVDTQHLLQHLATEARVSASSINSRLANASTPAPAIPDHSAIRPRENT
jgi:thiol:disulfide interchange protein DsbD